MAVRKETLFVWVGLAVAGIVIVGLFGGRMNLWAGGEIEQPASVSVVPLQLGRESYGVAMVDAKSETIWIYEINTRAPAHSRLKLMAARSWHYDKLLEEYNSAQPRPREVKNIIEQLLRPGGTSPIVEANSPDMMTLAEPNQNQNSEVRIKAME
jgi:hypothetical protein